MDEKTPTTVQVDGHPPVPINTVLDLLLYSMLTDNKKTGEENAKLRKKLPSERTVMDWLGRFVIALVLIFGIGYAGAKIGEYNAEKNIRTLTLQPSTELQVLVLPEAKNKNTLKAKISLSMNDELSDVLETSNLTFPDEGNGRWDMRRRYCRAKITAHDITLYDDKSVLVNIEITPDLAASLLQKTMMRIIDAYLYFKISN